MNEWCDRMKDEDDAKGKKRRTYREWRMGTGERIEKEEIIDNFYFILMF